ncbi:DNA-processing protein DprA [Jiulongibacter sediminis]|uniref:DNA-processing protein DprA n=1 Tax=Jiulongibacter sediminis TaxID=1605367 RepID=UPI0026F25128|nr:DNA-processing protein DprA [Jiulongibacter sediminis]
MQEDLIYKLALKEADGVGGVLFRHLVSFFGSARAVLEAPSGQLQKVQGIGKGNISKIKKASEGLNEAERLLNDSLKKGYKIITFQDAEYPLRFKGLYDAPPVLFVHGESNLNENRTIGIVGTRKATEYGKEVTDQIVSGLKPYGVSVISGLAYGIDIAAHKSALKNEMSTIAVMAGGLDSVYPAAHKKYARDIAQKGALVTENKNSTLPVGPQFIARNRIIAALSDVTVIVESAARGGGLVTAEYANNYHRDVYAIPGNINQPFSEGPNNLIKRNKARIFTSINALVKDMGWDLDGQKSEAVYRAELDLTQFTDDESKILSLLRDKGECLIDDLSFESNIPLNKLASLLLNLEFQEAVKALPGKKFKLR